MSATFPELFHSAASIKQISKRFALNVFPLYWIITNQSAKTLSAESVTVAGTRSTNKDRKKGKH